jgi:hypothetical protein
VGIPEASGGLAGTKLASATLQRAFTRVYALFWIHDFLLTFRKKAILYLFQLLDEQRLS